MDDSYDIPHLFDPAAYGRSKTLVFMLAARSSYRPVMFSADEIFCGPDCVPDGRNVRTPEGDYDIAEVLRQLPSGWTPETIIVKADAAGRNFPRHLRQTGARTVLISGNTCLAYGALRRVLQYAQDEQFDNVISDNERHHLHYFAEAGFPRVAWFPAINIYPHWQERSGREPWEYDLSFIGQAGRFHPYRNGLLQAVKTRRYHALIGRLPQAEAAAAYAGTQINLNCSMNGDFNLRIFEVLSSGGFLLTDRLSAQSGMELMLRRGVDFDDYGSEQELLEKIDDYLAHPERCREIAACGYRRFWADHDPRLKVRKFWEYIIDGKLDGRFSLSAEPRAAVTSLPGREELSERMAKYDFIQNLQLKNPQSRVLLLTAGDAELRADLSDLPRVKTFADDGRPDASCWSALVIAADRLDAELAETNKIDAFLRRYPFLRLLVSGVPNAHTTAVLTNAGLSRFESDHEIYVWTDIAVPSLVFIAAGMDGALVALEKYRPDQYHAARIDYFAGIAAWDGGQPERGAAYLKKYLPQDRFNRRALEILIDYAVRQRHWTEAIADGEDWLRSNPGEEQIMNRLAGWYLDADRPAEACRYYERSLAMHPEQDAIRRRLARVQARLVPPTNPAPTGKRYRILAINNLYPPQELGGYGRSLFDFAESLKRRGHELKILTADVPELGPVAKGSEPDVERTLQLYGEWVDGVAVRHTPESCRETVQKNSAVLNHALEVWKPDLVLAGNLDFVDVGLIDELVRRSIPVVHHLGFCRNPFPGGKLPDSPYYFLAGASRWVMDKNVPPGYRNCDFVYPGAWVDEFAIHTPIGTERLRIAYASLLTESKGVGVLLNALHRLDEQSVDYSCTLAGLPLDRKLRDHLEQNIRDNQLEHRVVMAGNLDRQGLKALYASHNVLVFPSLLEEAFGISQVEAMAAGVAVITTGLGGAAEVVKNDLSGLVTPPGDADALASALASLPSDPERWSRLAANGQRRARELFDVERSVDKLERIFARLPGRK